MLMSYTKYKKGQSICLSMRKNNKGQYYSLPGSGAFMRRIDVVASYN
jgi:hypothetical protein